MKKILRFQALLSPKFLVFALALSFCGFNVYAQLPQSIEFTGGTVGNSVTAAPLSWATNGTGTATFLIANTSPLSYTGYSGGTGNYLEVTKGANTINVSTPSFSSTAGTNTYYYSFLVRVGATTTSSDYFAALSTTFSSGSYFARLFMQPATGGYNLGISKTSATGTYNASPTLLTTGTTYLVVVKYVYVSGATNDEVYMWINPAVTSEPSNASAEASISTGTDGTALASNGVFTLRSGALAPNYAIDGIKVATGTTSALAFSSLAPDVTPPTYISTYPKAGTITPLSIEILTKLNEAGKTYFVIQPVGVTAPSIAQIKAGQDGTGATSSFTASISVAANTEGAATVSGLTPSTTYKIYLISEDIVATPNVQASVSEGSEVTLDAVVLPVNLISYTAKAENNHAKLQWITSSESNNKGFEIERSIDAANYQKLAAIKGNASTNASNTYTWYDYAPFNGINYYRLKQVDNDGKVTVLDVRSVTFKLDASASASIYPNPTQEQINLLLKNYAGNSLKATITDISGKIVHSETINLSSGQNSYKLNPATKLHFGTYVISLVGEGFKEQLKLLVQ